MTIVCGTDFSKNGAEAASVAARIAAVTGTDLLLLHVFELGGAETVLLADPAEPSGPVRAFLDDEAARLRKRLQDEAQRLAVHGAKVQTELINGVVDEAVVRRAERANAELVVVGALGRRTAGSWALGSHADRVAQTSKRPVLVVRDGAAFDAWLAKREPLRVLVAMDGSATSDAAVAWSLKLCAFGACELTAVHVYWPPEQRERTAARGNDPREAALSGRAHADVEAELTAALRARCATLPGAERIRLRVVGGLGRPADHIVQTASEEKVHLTVVGNHQRKGISRLWHGSVSRGVIDLATCSVACVPTTTTS